MAAELVAAALQGIKVVGLGMVERKGKYQLLTYITGSWWQQTLWQQICGCWFLEGGEGKFGLRDTIPRRGLFKNIEFLICCDHMKVRVRQLVRQRAYDPYLGVYRWHEFVQ